MPRRVVRKILIDEAAFDSGNPSDVIRAVVDNVNWMMEVALLVPGEFPREALWVYHVDYYIAQVNNGGHGQFAFNSQMSTKTLENIENGLRAIGADDLLGIVKDLRAVPFFESGTELSTDALYQLPVLKALDEGFFSLRQVERIAADSIAWLRCPYMPCLRNVRRSRQEIACSRLAKQSSWHCVRSRRPQILR